MSGACAICGAPLPQGRRKYCSDACYQEAERRRGRSASEGRAHPPLRRERVCQDCGRCYIGHIKSKHCPQCQHEADKRHDAEYMRRKRAGHARELGSTDICQACGMPYTVESGAQRWCKACAPEQTRMTKNAMTRAWNRAAYSDPQRREAKNAGRRRKPEERICAACGKTFAVLGAAKYCSDACRTEARKAYDHAYSMTRRGKEIDE